jgi:hypothetical protein
VPCRLMGNGQSEFELPSSNPSIAPAAPKSPQSTHNAASSAFVSANPQAQTQHRFTQSQPPSLLSVLPSVPLQRPLPSSNYQQSHHHDTSEFRTNSQPPMLDQAAIHHSFHIRPQHRNPLAPQFTPASAPLLPLAPAPTAVTRIDVPTEYSSVSNLRPNRSQRHTNRHPRQYYRHQRYSSTSPNAINEEMWDDVGDAYNNTRSNFYGSSRHEDNRRSRASDSPSGFDGDRERYAYQNHSHSDNVRTSPPPRSLDLQHSSYSGGSWGSRNNRSPHSYDPSNFGRNLSASYSQRHRGWHSRTTTNRYEAVARDDDVVTTVPPSPPEDSHDTHEIRQSFALHARPEEIYWVGSVTPYETIREFVSFVHLP